MQCQAWLLHHGRGTMAPAAKCGHMDSIVATHYCVLSLPSFLSATSIAARITGYNCGLHNVDIMKTFLYRKQVNHNGFKLSAEDGNFLDL